MMWFDLRGSQEMGREPTPPDINVSWLGPRAITIIFIEDFIFRVRFIFRPGCARLSHAAGHSLISSDIHGSTHVRKGEQRAASGFLCEKMQSFKKGKRLPCPGCFSCSSHCNNHQVWSGLHFGRMSCNRRER